MSAIAGAGIAGIAGGAAAGAGLGILKNSKNNINWDGMANILFPGIPQTIDWIQQKKREKEVLESWEAKQEATNNNNNNDDDEEEKKEPWITLPNIQDKTEENLSYNVGSTMTTADYMKWSEEQQQKLWKREDELRKHIEMREDSAYQRAVEDARKSGINVAAMGGINPAESGGGITQATGMDTNVITQSMSSDIQKLIENITNNFEGSENEKDRLQSLLNTGIGALIVAFLKNAK